MISLLLTIAAIAMPSAETVRQHWHTYGQRSAHVRYLTLEHIPPAEYGDWHRALMFAVSSNSRDVVLHNHLPKRLDQTQSYYADLLALQWDANDLLKVMATYPYSLDKNPLTIRGDWLIYQLLDTRDSQASYLLLYGEKNIPKTDEEFWKFWGVDRKAQAKTTIGWAEGKSQVNLHGTRLATRYITTGTRSIGLSGWETDDSFFVTAKNDPLETLDNTFLHQGREHIAQFPKSSYKNGKLYTGAAQAYLLSQGNADRANKPLAADQVGKRVEEAPVDLVRDNNRCLGQDAIVNNISCIVCHDAGMKFPTTNGLENLLRIGAELYVYDRGKRDQAEQFHLTNAAIMLEQDNRLYGQFVEACTGLKSPELSKLIKKVTDAYRAPLTLDDAARELYCTPDDLKFAIGYASANHLALGNRLTALAHGEPMPRTQWETDYLLAQQMVGVWKAGTPAMMAGILKGQPQKLKTTMVVVCPADAKLFINGREATTATGPRREFTMDRKPDWRMTVAIKAVLLVDGKQLVQEKSVECVAGQTVEVAFDFKPAGVQS